MAISNIDLNPISHDGKLFVPWWKAIKRNDNETFNISETMHFFLKQLYW